jgi:hypothetical protein
MNDDHSVLREVLWKMYQEHCTQGRHHELQRSSVASVLIAVSAAVIGVASFDRQLSLGDLPVTAIVVLLGTFGAMFSAKHYERFELHMERARRYRDALDDLLPGTPLYKIKMEADLQHNGKYSRLHRFRLHYFWVGLYLVIMSIGIVMSVMCAVGSKSA